jgi:hypothetical protein
MTLLQDYYTSCIFHIFHIWIVVYDICSMACYTSIVQRMYEIVNSIYYILTLFVRVALEFPF